MGAGGGRAQPSCCFSVGPLAREGPAFRHQGETRSSANPLWRLPALDGRAQLSPMQIRKRRQRRQAASVAS